MKDLFFSPAIKGGKISDKLIGKTKFELTNVKTGEVEKMEFKNTFTDGIESYFRDLGMFQNSPYGASAVYQDNLWKDILGGILLFDTPLSTSPMAKYAPAGVRMIGNGAYGVSNSGNPSELGSYNALESSYTKDEIIMVYDFLTSQANGTIESVALTTFTGGFIGYGNNGPTVGESNYKELNNRQNSKSIGGITLDKTIYYNNRFYIPKDRYYNSGTTKIEIESSAAQTEKIDIFWAANWFVTDETLEFNLTTPLSGRYYVECIGGKYYPTHFALVPENSIAANSSFVFYLLDVATGTVTEKTITNNTSKTMLGRCFFPVSDTKALIQTTDYYLYQINISNSGVIGEAGIIQSNLAGRMKFLTDEIVAGGSGNWGYEYIYDSVLNRFKLTNGRVTYGSGYIDYMYSSELDACIRHYNYNGVSFSVYKCPLRLMTINNLSDAVTKTAEKTMKVTYTITRAQA